MNFLRSRITVAATFLIAFSSLAQEDGSSQLTTTEKNQFSIGYQLSNGAAKGVSIGYHFNKNHLSLFTSPLQFIDNRTCLLSLQYRHDILSVKRWTLGAFVGNGVVYRRDNGLQTTSGVSSRFIGGSLEYGFMGSLQINKHFYLNASLSHDIFVGHNNESGLHPNLIIQHSPTTSLGINYRF